MIITYEFIKGFECNVYRASSAQILIFHFIFYSIKSYEWAAFLQLMVPFKDKRVKVCRYRARTEIPNEDINHFSRTFDGKLVCLESEGQTFKYWFVESLLCALYIEGLITVSQRV